MDVYEREAVRLHRESTVADAHLDLITAVYRNVQVGINDSLKDHYLKKMKESGVNLVFASLFPGVQGLENFYEKSKEMLFSFLEELKKVGEEVMIITDRASLENVLTRKREHQNWPIGIVLYLEGLDMLDGDPERLREFYQMGIRGASLTWNKRPELPNPFAEGCTVTGKNQEEKIGITDKGAEVLSLMEELGIFVDCSHLCEEALDQLPLYTKLPYAATHSNAKALAHHPRNMTDEQIRLLSGRGGVIGVNTYWEFVTDKKPASDKGFVADKKPVKNKKIRMLDGICDQISYLIEMAGENHVGYGLDFGEGSCLEKEGGCYIDDLSGYEQFPMITAQLLRRGYPEETVRKITGENWARYLRKILR